MLKKRINIVICLTLTSFLLISCNLFNNDTANNGPMLLKKNNWDPNTYLALSKLIKNYGKSNPKI